MTALSDIKSQPPVMPKRIPKRRPLQPQTPGSDVVEEGTPTPKMTRTSTRCGRSSAATAQVLPHVPDELWSSNSSTCTTFLNKDDLHHLTMMCEGCIKWKRIKRKTPGKTRADY